MNWDYYISRQDILDSLGLPDKIPMGVTVAWRLTEVLAGYNRDKLLTLMVCVRKNGVANRIQIMCPKCSKIMRFCGLKQHIGTKVCERKSMFLENAQSNDTQVGVFERVLPLIPCPSGDE